MTAMFPDSGVPPADARNSLPDPVTQQCNELWYSTSRCQPRFDPAAANAVLAELVNLINRGQVTYDCRYLDQVQLAVRYIIQRGMETGAQAIGGPNNYQVTLDPALSHYNDHLTLIVVPAVTNASSVTLNYNGKGSRALVRNDGLALRKGDFQKGVPYIISYWAGKFWMLSFVRSQIPVQMLGDIDGWIRTDGNDETGDGTENTPDKAFRTINGAWAAMGKMFLPSMLYSINLRLGKPGRYEGGHLGPYGGNVCLYGDPANARDYIIEADPSTLKCLTVLQLYGIIDGVHFEMATTAGQAICLDLAQEATIRGGTLIFTGKSSNVGHFINVNHNSNFAQDGNIIIEGHGISVSKVIAVNRNSTWFGRIPFSEHSISMSNINVTTSAFLAVEGMSQMNLETGNIVSNPANCVGMRYRVTDNSILRARGLTVPGTPDTGVELTQGQFIE